jgi:hypothetical protein
MALNNVSIIIRDVEKYEKKKNVYGNFDIISRRRSFDGGKEVSSCS